MKTKEMKIRSAARKVVRGYIKTLEEGQEPMMLRAQIDMGKYDILGNVNDARLNMSDTLEAVRREAHWMIKDALTRRPELADKLIAFRKAREKRANEEAMEEQRSWKPFPLLKDH